MEQLTFLKALGGNISRERCGNYIIFSDLILKIMRHHFLVMKVTVHYFLLVTIKSLRLV